MFEVGRHAVLLSKIREGCWSVAVDGAPLSQTHRTLADAWEAGVREAYRLDAAPAR
jgi:aryl-alcohol dehydrogenase-like predicted oxidoreductase